MEVASSGLAAQILELGQVVGVCGGGEAREDAFFGKEEGASADRENGSLSGGVLLLKFREVGNEARRLCLFLKNLLGIAAKDDEDVELLKAFVGLFERDLRAHDDTLLGDDLRLSTSKGDLESPGGWSGVIMLVL